MVILVKYNKTPIISKNTRIYQGENLIDILDIYVQENFGVKAEYDEENNVINLSTSNINEGLQLIAAKEYIDNNFDSDFITTNI